VGGLPALVAGIQLGHRVLELCVCRVAGQVGRVPDAWVRLSCPNTSARTAGTLEKASDARRAADGRLQAISKRLYASDWMALAPSVYTRKAWKSPGRMVATIRNSRAARWNTSLARRTSAAAAATCPLRSAAVAARS